MHRKVIKRTSTTVKAMNSEAVNTVEKGFVQNHVKSSSFKCEGQKEDGSHCANCETGTHTCAACTVSFTTICLLHEHMVTSHWCSESYSYNFKVHSAYPKYETLCQWTQTEDVGFSREGLFDSLCHNEVSDEYMNVGNMVADSSGFVDCKENIHTNHDSDGHSDLTDDYFDQNEINMGDPTELKSSFTEIKTETAKISQPVTKVSNYHPPATKKSQERKVKNCNKSKRKLKAVSRKASSIDSDVTDKKVNNLVEEDDFKIQKAVPVLSTCNDKNITVVKIELDENKTMESYNDSKCSICEVTFSKKQTLLRHEQQKHYNEMKYQCDQCDKKFMRNFNLQKHMIRVHSKPNKTKFKHDDIPTSNISDNKVDSTMESDLVIDMQKTGEKACRKRRTNAEVENMKAPHTCDICGHTMPKYKMDVHKRLHTGDRPYVCTICGKGLISQNKLSRHMMIHTHKKKHQCEECGASFHMKYKLRMHMHIHTGNKPYLCSICGAEFNHSANLATHTRCVHLQVKPYECDICGGKYSKRSQLDDHVFSHSAERKFTCRYCGKTFKYYKGMRRHEKSHTEDESFTCTQCGLKFARKENLDKHMVTHGTAASEFQCKICKKVLKDSRALQEHEFTHLVAKGCKCPNCGEMYYSSNKFFNHLSTMHKICKQEAQLMIIDEQLKLHNKECVGELEKQSKANNTITHNVTKPSNVFETVTDDCKDTMSLLTRVATENLRLHSQDVSATEKVNIITPPINPMILYDKNGVTPIDHVTTNRQYIMGPKDIGNTQMNVAGFTNHGYGQHLKPTNDQGNHGNNCRILTLQIGDGNVAQGLHEPSLGFVTSNTLTSISNLTSYMGQRSNTLTPLSNLTVGLHQDEHGAIESLRQLQDNPVLPVTGGANTAIILDNTTQQNVLLPTTVTNIDNSPAEYRIQNLF